MKLLVFVLLLVGQNALAQLILPNAFAPSEFAVPPEYHVRDIYPGLRPEKMAQLRDVQALKFDIPLVKKDFPFMRDWSPGRIYKWFEKKAGLVSLQQTRQQNVNTKIETTGVLVDAYRPPGYGRAVIVEYNEGGYEGAFEVKMSGVGPNAWPHQGPHGNGIGALAEVIREDDFENMERAAIAHYVREKRAKGEPTKIGGTVAFYGYMYAGYYLRHPSGEVVPAGISIRQAHRRLNYDNGVRAAWLPSDMKNEVLRQISKYGFYTGWESNIQGLVKNDKVFVFDFGHWIGWMGFVPESGISVDPRIAVNFNLWGFRPENGPRRDQDQWRTSIMDNPADWSRWVANQLHRGGGQAKIVEHFNQLVVPDMEKLGVAEHLPMACRIIF